MLVVHPHFHPRRTGVTAHVDQIVGALNELVETRAMGRQLAPALPRIGLSELLKRSKLGPVIWHAHRNNELLFGLLLKVMRRHVSLVATRHGSSVPGAFTQWLFRRADAVITLNDQLSKLVKVKSTIVPHGVSLKQFSAPLSKAEAWAKLQLPGTHGVGVIGRIRPEKGQGDFAAAIGPLLKAHPEWTPVLVGLAKDADAQWLHGLRQQTDQKLQFAGEIREVAAWYQGLQVVVQPSHREAFSMVWVEAMASGACLIASALPPVTQVIEDGRTGLLFPVGDVKALRECLQRVMKEPTFAEQLGRNAAEAAKARFGVEHEAKALYAVYQSVIAALPS